MSIEHRHAREYVDRLLRAHTLDELAHRLEPKLENPAPKVPRVTRPTLDGLEHRWQVLNSRPEHRKALADPQTLLHLESYQHRKSAVGVTRLEVTPQGELYAAVTLPNLTVGSVGGGTGLPSQHACLAILGLAGPGNAAALAEVCAGLCLSGELSIIGALCAGNFARAHGCLARGKASRRNNEEAACDQSLAALSA